MSLPVVASCSNGTAPGLMVLRQAIRRLADSSCSARADDAGDNDAIRRAGAKATSWIQQAASVVINKGARALFQAASH